MKQPSQKPIRSAKLNEMVASRIKDYIIEHNLGEGDRLPTEQQMTEMFGVSRVSIREATRALSFLGIIHSAPRRGLTIGHVDMDRVTEYLGFHFAMNDYPIKQLIKTRLVIEIGALTEAMERISGNPAVYQRLIALNEKVLQSKDPDSFVSADLAFHRGLIECSDIEPLIAFNSLLEVFFKRVGKNNVNFQKPSVWPAACEAHKELLTLLRSRNLQKAQDFLRKHISGSVMGYPCD